MMMANYTANNCKNYGFDHYAITYATKMRIVKAASRMIAYDNGFLYEFNTSTILQWDANVTKSINEGVSSTNISCNNYTTREKVVDQIEKAHPGYLHFYIVKHKK